MSTEIASAYLALYAKMPGVQKDIEKSLGGSDVQGAAEKSGKSMGGKLMSAAGKAAALGAIAVGATVAAGVGVALAKGFARLDAIDQAEAKLSGLGHSAGAIGGIMDNALSAVQGTAFGLDAAATTAASAIAAGVKPGADLAKHLSLVADAATIAGTGMDTMGAIFGKVSASNKLQGDVIAQLHDAGIPALALVAKQLGVTSEEASKLASSGAIDFATFSAAMEAGLGGSALAAGDTFQGALANVGASLGRIGAGLEGGLFPHLAPILQAATAALKPFEVLAGDLGAKLGEKLAPAVEWLTGELKGMGDFDFAVFAAAVTQFSPLVMVLQALQPVMPVIISALQQVAEVLAGALGTILPMVIPLISQLVVMFAQLAAEVLPVLIPALTGALLPIISALVPVISMLLTALGPIVEAVLPVLSTLFAALAPIVMQLVGAFLPLLEPILALIEPLLDLVMVILPPLMTIIGFLIQAALVPLQLAMKAIIPIVTGVVSALSTYLIPVIDTVKNVLSGLSTFLSGVFAGDWGRAWDGIAQVFSGVWQGIQDIARGTINGIIELINGVISGINGVAGGVSDLTGGAISLAIPMIPKLASGGIVSPIPGGVLANIGEGRYPEAVTPLAGPQFTKLARAFASEVQPAASASGGLTIHGDVVTADTREFIREVEKSQTRARMQAGGRLVTA